MKSDHVIRTWKDEEYRLNLSDAERALLPQHPSGMIELTGAELQGAAGGTIYWIPTLGCTLFCTYHC
ncbi:MAG: mersacidin/lichenicidin family type 2 lantibiotic, partial [Acidobacteriaceae bacterium]|nr:mersacidin/lichenicidin family type 2 lantibiotic [Acidobacteriaceae bacterium]